jgi:hypothetical protein
MKETIYYADEEMQKTINADFELIESKGWFLLYRNKADKTYWRLDRHDKLQQQCFVKLNKVEKWDEFDDKELRIHLLQRTRGLGKEKCIWNQCERNRLQDLVYCERHAYEIGIRR